jgi:WD40 repeat protein
MKVGTSHQLRFSPDGHYVVSIGRNVVLWDLRTRKRVTHCHPLQHPSHMDFSKDGKLLAVKNTSGQIVILNVPNLDTLSVIKGKSRKEGCQPLFSPCGRFLLDGSWDGRICIHDWRRQDVELEESHSNSMIVSITSSGSRDFFGYAVSPKATDEYSPPGNSSILCRKWPFTNNSGLVLPVQVRWASTIALSPSGKRILVLQQKAALRFSLVMYEMPSGTVLARRNIQFGAANFSVAWSPDESLVACAEKDKVLVLRVPDLELLDEFPCMYCCHVEFSPDGQKLASGSWTQGEIRDLPRALT